jgi:hypothetical protein
MNWKKLLLIGLAVGGFAFATASSSQAGISIGIGVPVGYGYGYYPYGYGYYPYPYYRGYYRPFGYVGPRYYWRHGHRVFYHRRHW